MSRNEEDDDDIHGQYAMQLVSASSAHGVDINYRTWCPSCHTQSWSWRSTLSFTNCSSTCYLEQTTCPFNSIKFSVFLLVTLFLTCSLATKDDECQVDCLYGLAPVAKYFIRKQYGGGGRLAPLLELIWDKVMLNMWYHLKEAVVEGDIPFNKAYETSAVEYVGKNAKLGEIFKDFMRDFNPIFMQRILEMYRGFDGLKSLLMLGGGNGFILSMILSKYPNIKAVNYDLHPIRKVDHLSWCQLFTFSNQDFSGDMFVDIPKGEAIFMKWILQSWDDEHRVKMLKNCYDQ